MNLLRRCYLYNFFKKSQLKLIYSLIIYKIFIKFNFLFFFNFRSLLITFFFYRFYLLSTNFSFIFTDYIYLITYIFFFNKHNASLFSLPIRTKSYSVLRSPFIYSKSREHFAINYYSIFFQIKFPIASELYFYFLDKMLFNIKLNNSKFWYKRIIEL